MFASLSVPFLLTLRKARNLIADSTVEDVSMGELIRSGLGRMVQGLAKANGDAYSYYLSPKSAQNLQNSLHNDSFGGAGILIEYLTDIQKILVLSVLPDTPAYRAGLQAGDLIIKLDGVALKDIPVDSPEAAKE